REDLFVRLNVVAIRMPPLRERIEHLPALLAHYLKHLAAENDLPIPSVEPGAPATLTSSRSPSNHREQRQFCENTVVLHRGGKIIEYDIDPRFRAAAGGESGGGAGAGTAAAGGGSAPVVNSLSVTDNEKRLLREALIKARGNRTKAAK